MQGTEKNKGKESVKKLSVKDFSKKVKEKYPEYKDVDDLVLAKKIVEKYPEYESQVSFDDVKKKDPTAEDSSTPSEQPTTPSKESGQENPEASQVDSAIRNYQLPTQPPEMASESTGTPASMPEIQERNDQMLDEAETLTSDPFLEEGEPSVPIQNREELNTKIQTLRESTAPAVEELAKQGEKLEKYRKDWDKIGGFNKKASEEFNDLVSAYNNDYDKLMKDSELIDRWAEKQSSALFEGETSPMLDAFHSGMNKQIASIYRTPEFVWDVAANAYNLLLDAQDAVMPESLQSDGARVMSSNQMSDATGIDNKFAEGLEAASEELDKVTALHHKPITESLMNGNYGDAFYSTGLSISESLPFMLSVMIPSAAGVSATKMFGGITTAMAAGRKQDLINDDSLTETQKNGNAIVHGVAEGFEALIGGGNTGRVIRKSLQEEGIEVAKKRGMDMVEQIIKESPYLDPFREMLQEMFTTYTQNLADIYINGEEKNPLEGVSDAGIVGFSMGGGSGTVSAVVKYLSKNPKTKLSAINEAALNGKMKKAIVDNIDGQVIAGKITKKEGELKKMELDNDIATNFEIPESIQGDDRVEALELQKEYKAQKDKRDQVGEAFKEPYTEKLKSIEEKLKGIQARAESKSVISKGGEMKVFTSPTDEKYATVNRNDGKGSVTLTKAEYDAEAGKIADEFFGEIDQAESEDQLTELFGRVEESGLDNQDKKVVEDIIIDELINKENENKGVVSETESEATEVAKGETINSAKQVEKEKVDSTENLDGKITNTDGSVESVTVVSKNMEPSIIITESGEKIPMDGEYEYVQLDDGVYALAITLDKDGRKIIVNDINVDFLNNQISQLSDQVETSDTELDAAIEAVENVDAPEMEEAENSKREEKRRELLDKTKKDGAQNTQESNQNAGEAVPAQNQGAINPESSRNYRNLTEDNNGNLVFYHISPNEMDQTDPSMAGNNSATSKEEATSLRKVGGATMFYTRPEDGEANVVGDNKYMFKVPAEKVYDFNEDPLNFIEEARERNKKENGDGAEFSFNTQLAYIAKIANENGFDMTVGRWNNKTRAQSSKSLSPVDVETRNKNQVTKSFNEEYESNTKKAGPVTFEVGDKITKNGRAATITKVEDGKYSYTAEGGNVSGIFSKRDIDNGSVQLEEKAAPKKKKTLFNKPVPVVKKVADKVKKAIGIKDDGGSNIKKLDTERSKEIADAYEAMKHNPNNKEVKEAYEAMAKETIDQYQAIVNEGVVFELYEGKGEPYANSKEMLEDLESGHLYVLPTEAEFGQNKITDKQRKDNPLLRDSGLKDTNGNTLLVNDIFRGVHDFFGHGERGNGFGAIGEENAWDVHSRMYSDKARRAMTTETRGQNSWVNFGKQMRNEDGSIKKKGDDGYMSPMERPFAEQKIGLLPAEFSENNYSDKPIEEAAKKEEAPKKKEAKKEEKKKRTKPDEDTDVKQEEFMGEKIPKSMDKKFFDKQLSELGKLGGNLMGKKWVVIKKMLDIARVRKQISQDDFMNYNKRAKSIATNEALGSVNSYIDEQNKRRSDRNINSASLLPDIVDIVTLFRDAYLAGKDLVASMQEALAALEKKMNKAGMEYSPAAVQEFKDTVRGLVMKEGSMNKPNSEVSDMKVDFVKNEISEVLASNLPLAEKTKALMSMSRDLMKALRLSGVRNVPTLKVEGLLNKMKQAKTQYSHEKAALEIMDLADKVKKKDNDLKRAALVNGMIKFVKKAKATKSINAKTRAGSLDPDTRAMFQQVDTFLRAMKAGEVDLVSQKLVTNQDQIAEAMLKDPADMTSRERELVGLYYASGMLSEIESMPIEDLAELFKSIKGLKSIGIARLKQMKAKSKARRDNINDEAEFFAREEYEKELYNENGDLITETEKLDKKRRNRFKRNKKSPVKGRMQKKTNIQGVLKEHLDEINGVKKRPQLRSLLTMESILNTLDRGSEFFENSIRRPLNKMFRDKIKGVQDQRAKMDNLVNESFEDYSNFSEYVRGESDILTEIELKNGRKLVLSNLGIARLYSIYKDPVQRLKLQNQGVDANAMVQMQNAMGKEHMDFADKVVDYLSNDYYESINIVHEKVNYVSLPRIDQYFPVKVERMAGENVAMGNFSKNFNAQTQTALKQRVDTTTDIKIEEDGMNFATELMSHFEDMEQFKAYADGVKGIDTVMTNPHINNLLELNDVKRIVELLVDFSINEKAHTNTPSMFNTFQSKFTSLMLGFKPMQLIKQATSFVNAFEDYEFMGGKKFSPIDIPMFALDYAKVLLKLPSEISKMKEISPLFKERLENPDIAALYNNLNAARGKKKMSKIQRIGNWFTYMGDIFGVLGYAAVYNRNIANGMDKAKAAEMFEEYNSTQQSRRPQDMTELQVKKHWVTRTVTTFMSTSFLMINKAYNSQLDFRRDLKKGKWNAKALRGFFLSVGAANTMFVLASNMFKLILGDEEDADEVLIEMEKAMMGVKMFSAVPLIGSLLEEVVDRNIYDKKPWKSGGGVNPFDRVAISYAKVAKEDATSSEIFDAINLSQGLITGVNIKALDGLYKLMDGDDEMQMDGILDILGVSKSYKPKNEQGEGETEFKSITYRLMGKGGPERGRRSRPERATRERPERERPTRRRRSR